MYLQPLPPFGLIYLTFYVLGPLRTIERYDIEIIPLREHTKTTVLNNRLSFNLHVLSSHCMHCSWIPGTWMELRGAKGCALLRKAEDSGMAGINGHKTYTSEAPTIHQLEFLLLQPPSSSPCSHSIS